MPLADDIRQLRDRSLQDLAAAHDYYVDTRKAWQVVRRVVKAGKTLTVQNSVTGNETAGPELVVKGRGYVAKQLAEATFQQFVSVFENYFFDLLRLWLAAFPQSLSEKSVKIEEVLKASDKEAILLLAIDKHLNELAYKKVREWFEYLNYLAKPGCPKDDEIARLAEAKASRDIFVHNRGVANKTYEDKAGALARAKAGQPLDLPEPYHQVTWQLFQMVIADVSDAVAVKAP